MESHQQRRISEDVERMSFAERLEYFQARVVINLDDAPECIQTFADRACRRYRQRF